MVKINCNISEQANKNIKVFMALNGISSKEEGLDKLLTSAIIKEMLEKELVSLNNSNNL